MELVIVPKKSFDKIEEAKLKKIIQFAENLLEKNGISIPKKIYFYNSFTDFVYRVLPEVKDYGFSKDCSREIVLCALNNGTYGTIGYKEDSILEINFNPFNQGEYLPEDFLELIIHESIHLHLYKAMNLDVNSLKFKFNNEVYIGNSKIIQLDEGYAKFMTHKILNGINTANIKKIKIPSLIKEKPLYKKKIGGLDVDIFDRNFEELLIKNRNIGVDFLSKKFNFNDDNEKILLFVISELRKIV